MKTVVISGGSSGIGEAIIHKFLAHDYIVYNLDIKDNGKLAIHQNYKYIQTDASKDEEVQSAINLIVSKHSFIDIVIANAGKHLSANIETTTNEQLYEILNLNLLGAYWLIKHTIPHMKTNGGSIITIGSDQSSIAKENSVVYGMTKSALAHLTKSTALDYAKFNIRANCIGVGTINTPLYQAAIKKYSQRSGIALETIEQNEATEQPIGRIGYASEVAELAYFLAQDNVSYITGALIPIDGGYIIQ